MSNVYQFIRASYVNGEDLATFFQYEGSAKDLRDYMDYISALPGCTYTVLYADGSTWVERIHSNDGPKGETLHFPPGANAKLIEFLDNLST